MTSAFDLPDRQSLKDLRAEYPNHQELADQKYYKHLFAPPDDRYLKRRRSIERHFDELEENGLGPEASQYYGPKPQGVPAAMGQTRTQNQPLVRDSAGGGVG
jgi:hypothetical protein